MIMYPSQFEDDTEDRWVKEYENILDGHYDYNRLWEILVAEYSSYKTPSTSWLSERLSRCKLEQIQSAPVYNTYFDIDITAAELYGKGGNYVYRTTVTENQLSKLKEKGKKFTVVREAYRMGG
jgi:hypothetical protein